MTYYLAYRTAEGQRGRFRLGAKDALTVRQARDLAETQAARVRTGVDIHAARKEARHQIARAKLETLGGFIEQQYGPWLLAERPESRHSIEPLSRLQANFGDLFPHPMENISPWIIEKWRAEQRKRGKASSAVNRDLAPLKALLNKAVTWGVIEQNPLAPLKPLKTDALAAFATSRTMKKSVCGTLWRSEMPVSKLDAHAAMTGAGNAAMRRCPVSTSALTATPSHRWCCSPSIRECAVARPFTCDGTILMGGQTR
jgi:hypothetical protein